MSKLKTTAVVEVTIYVELTQPWSEEETVARVHARAQEEALSRVRNLVQQNALMRVAEARARVVMAEEES